MSTSGSTDFNLVTNEIIEKMFRIIGVGSEGEPLTARMYEDGRSTLNLLIKTWGAAEHLWTMTEGYIVLVAGQAAYQIGTLSPKPMRVLSLRRQVISSGNETPMTEMGRQEYFDQPNKTSSPSTPTSFYYDPQTTTGTLYLWPAPSTVVAPLNTMRITYLRRMDDFDSSNDDADLPQEWLQALIWNGANDLEPEYPVNDARLALKIERRAEQLYNDLKGWDNEPASMYLQPDMRWSGWGNRW